MMLTVRFCVPCIPEPGSTMLRVGWATTTLKLTVSTSVPVVKINRFVWAWVAVMVMLAKAVVGLVTWKLFT